MQLHANARGHWICLASGKVFLNAFLQQCVRVRPVKLSNVRGVHDFKPSLPCTQPPNSHIMRHTACMPASLHRVVSMPSAVYNRPLQLPSPPLGEVPGVCMDAMPLRYSAIGFRHWQHQGPVVDFKAPRQLREHCCWRSEGWGHTNLRARHVKKFHTLFTVLGLQP